MALLLDDDKLPNLYKYRENSDHTFENLQIGQLRFSHPYEFNDPFDCKVNVVFKGMEQDWIRWINEQPGTVMQKKSIYDYLKSIGFDGKLFSGTREQEDIRVLLVLSLSEINDNVLMWSHYTKYHKGLCFGFKSEIQGESLGLNFNESDVLFRGSAITPGFLPVRKVKYSIDMPPIFNSLKDDSIRLMDFSLVKHPDWAYERERRITVATPHLKQQMVKYEKEILDEVIFGYKTSKDDIDRTIRILRNNYPNNGKNIKWKKAMPVKGKYSLKITDL